MCIRDRISVVPFREYVDDDVAPHLIGTVGPIYAEDWEELRDKGYSYNDKVGRSGMEQAAEEYLRGQNGTMLVTQDASGNTLSSEVTEAPVAGNTVLMSIDKNLQRVAQVQLKNMIDQLKTETNGEADAGAVVGVNVKTGGVLFSANYPSYTMTEYKENYTALASDSSNPLFDRAFNGLYPPGSVFKPAVAAAGLQEGVITPTETIRCVQRYTRFADYQPKCLGYHGSINVTRALSRSCNYFFYETGYRLGISRPVSYTHLDVYKRQPAGSRRPLLPPVHRGDLLPPDRGRDCSLCGYGGAYGQGRGLRHPGQGLGPGGGHPGGLLHGGGPARRPDGAGPAGMGRPARRPVTRPS